MAKYKLVKFDFDSLKLEMHAVYPFTRIDRFVLLGEITQMPGHCVVVRVSDGRFFSGYHTDDFVVLTEEEC